MTRTTKLWIALATAVVGALGLVAVLVVVGRSGGTPQVAPIDRGAPTRLAAEAPSGTPTSPASTPPATSAAPRTDTRPSTSPRPSTRSATAGRTGRVTVAGQPVRVTIGSVSVDAPVIAVGVAGNGDVAIPEDIAEVGWYRYAAAPGATQGSTVLVGHVDSAVAGEGAFFRLRDVGAGNLVRVQLSTGKVLTYRVVSRVQFPKPQVPLDDLFAVTGAPRLTLITCGGSFDETRRSYRDNVVVTAVPA